MKTGVLTRTILAVLALYGLSTASAAMLVTLSSNRVDCKEDFGVSARFTTDTMNTQAEFYADKYLFETKNPAGNLEISVRFGVRPDDWDNLRPGTHNLTVKLIKQDQILEDGRAEFTVQGRRCPQPKTTTTTMPHIPPELINCTSDLDCASPFAENTTCNEDAVYQILHWGRCINPGTVDSICVDMTENVTVEVCSPDRICENGACKSPEEPTTTSETTTTTVETSSTTATTVETTTTTLPTTTTTPIIKRTNTKFDRLAEILEQILHFLFW